MAHHQQQGPWVLKERITGYLRQDLPSRVKIYREFWGVDDRLLPMQIMIGNSLGVGVMNLAADCRRDPAPCEAFGQEQAQAPKN